MGPGGSAAPRAAAEVVGPLALHTPLSNSSEAHAWDSSSPSFLDRLPGWGARDSPGSRGSWGCRAGFYALPFHRCVTPLPLRLMLLLCPNAYDTLFELRRSHTEMGATGVFDILWVTLRIHDPFLSLYSH